MIANLTDLNIHCIIILCITFWSCKMAKVTLTKWGNSIGFRIPVVILKETNLALGSELDISTDENGALILKQTQNPQNNWQAQFNAIADLAEDDLLLDTHNDFDDNEWTW